MNSYQLTKSFNHSCIIIVMIIIIIIIIFPSPLFLFYEYKKIFFKLNIKKHLMYKIFFLFLKHFMVNKRPLMKQINKMGTK